MRHANGGNNREVELPSDEDPGDIMSCLATDWATEAATPNAIIYIYMGSNLINAKNSA